MERRSYFSINELKCQTLQFCVPFHQQRIRKMPNGDNETESNDTLPEEGSVF